MKRLIAAMLIGLVLLAGIAFAEDPGLSIAAPGEEIRPGRPVVLSFTAPEDGACTIALTNDDLDPWTLTLGAGGREVRLAFPRGTMLIFR